MGKWFVLLAMATGGLWAQEGSQLVLASMAIRWPIAARAIEEDQRAIQNAAPSGRGCHPATFSKMNLAIADRSVEFLNQTLTYTQNIASSGHSLNKDSIGAAILGYRDSALSKLITYICAQPVTPDPADVTAIKSQFDLAVLRLAPIFPVRDTVRIRDTLRVVIRDTVIKRDTVVRRDTVKYCPPTLAKSGARSDVQLREVAGADAAGRSMKVWARCKE